MKPDRLSVAVQEIREITPSVRAFTLIAADGGPLPGFSSGSHVRVAVHAGEHRFENAYSLINPPLASPHYQIAVRRQANGRGGSRFLHDQVQAGSRLSLSPPVNMFPLAVTARRHLFVAGGIGITPILSHIGTLAYLNAPFELHFLVRHIAEGPFAAELADRYPGQVRLYRREAGDLFDIDALLAGQKLGTHLYVCGPSRLIDAAGNAARSLGWPARYVHVERFTSAAAGRPFTAVLARSGRAIEVAAETSLLEALENAGIEMPYLCRGGACGRCETGLLAGKAEHRDCFLDDAVKAAHSRIMPCVSRAAAGPLLLDL